MLDLIFNMTFFMLSFKGQKCYLSWVKIISNHSRSFSLRWFSFLSYGKRHEILYFFYRCVWSTRLTSFPFCTVVACVRKARATTERWCSVISLRRVILNLQKMIFVLLILLCITTTTRHTEKGKEASKRN